jgi:hypothetical protein
MDNPTSIINRGLKGFSRFQFSLKILTFILFSMLIASCASDKKSSEELKKEEQRKLKLLEETKCKKDEFAKFNNGAFSNSKRPNSYSDMKQIESMQFDTLVTCAQLKDACLKFVVEEARQIVNDSKKQ